MRSRGPFHEDVCLASVTRRGLPTVGIVALALLAACATPSPALGDAHGTAIFAGGFESGTICAWSAAVGWSGSPCVALQITVTEGGAPLADGALFNRPVVPVLGTTGGTAPIALEATLDGVPFTSGSTVTGDAPYLLEVSAEDADGLSAQGTVHFTIDTVGPDFVTVAPPEGFVTAYPTVVLSGEISGATTLTVNGAPATLNNGLFSTSPLPLAEGSQNFLLVATDLAGNATSLARGIVRDSVSPGVTILQPTPGVVASSPISVAGVATDPNLAQVLVNGQAAAISGATFSLSGLALVEGANVIVAEALDAVGNPPGTASVAVTLDSLEPVLDFLESGLPLADGALFNRTVFPVVVATDATQVSVSGTLNGVPFASGTPVADEGSYTLQATAVDEGGNSANLAADFAIDKTAPAFVAVQPPDDTLVASPVVVLTGEVAEAQSVTVEGQACALAGEAFSCPPFPLDDGERIFQLRARDAAGNETPRVHRIRRDGSAPEVVVASPAEGAYLAMAEVMVAGTAVDLHLADVRVNGVLATLVGSAWSAGPIVLAEGGATLEVSARDTVDNTTVLSRGVTIDSLAPEVDLLESGAPLPTVALFNRPITPVIVVADASPWTLVATLDGAPFVSATPVASEGLHLLQATVTDAAGNATTRQASFRVDGSPPALVTISPVDGHVTAAAEVYLQGELLGAESLTIDGIPVPLFGGQFVAGPFSLAEGQRSFAIVARDAAGNEMSRLHRVIRDITAPSVSILQPGAGALVGASAVQVTGQVTDPHLESVLVNGVEASLSGTGLRSWVAAQVPLPEGDSTLTATAVDRAGNLASENRVLVRDSQAPTLTITDPAAGSVVPEAAVVVSGTVGEPNLDRVTVQGVAAQVEAGTFSASVALVEGENTLVVRAIDRLGHATEESRLVRRDSTAPALEIDSPEEGSRIAAESVPVSGSLQEADGVTLTVNGIVAVIAGETFSAAAVPLVEGENRLIARARDANGNVGVRTRTVVRDTTAPTILGTEPPAGALAVALATVFAVELSEAPGPASVGGVRLEAGSGAPLSGAVELLATGLRFTPAAPLPSTELVRLRLDSSIVDLAGNPLAAGATFEFATADATAPAAPTVLNPPPRFLCATAVTLGGFAEPERWVEVVGGAGAARVRASSEGAYTVVVELVPSTIHRLAVTSVDDAGNRSFATELEVVHDCVGPIVESVAAAPAGFTIRFSEAIDPTSLAGSVLVLGASGAVDGSLTLDVDLATFTAAAALPEGALRVEVLRQPRDLAGNLLAYSWVSLFGGDAAASFFVATVLDDEEGRPLAGARARVLATDGVPPPAGTSLESTSSSDGALSLPVPVGTHLVAFERPDAVPIFRVVTTEAQQGTDVVDPRLTPLAEATTVGPAGGTVGAGTTISVPAPDLLVPAGALTDDRAISLTVLSEQGLPRLLPFGWAPRGAVWIGPEETELLLPATLKLPVDASPGSTVAWVHLDPETRIWRVEGVTTLGVTELEFPLAEAGAWAVVEADPPPFAVPAAVAGEPLGSLPAPPGDTILGAALAFDPETVLPGQRSLATATYTATEAAASGSTVTLSIAEELQLLDGTARTEPSYRSDLVIYRSDGGARSRFFLAASEAARRLPIELGEENVAVLPYGGEIVRGNVLGPQGGSVLDPSGDRIDVPAGALVRPTPVQLESTNASSLPLPVPQGFAFAGALRIDLSGELLLAPATLFLALADPPSAAESGILFGLESLADGDTAWRPLAAITPTGAGWQSDPITPSDLPWPGVTRGGAYLFARSLAPLGFARGTVFDVGGAVLAGAVVASAGSNPVEWIQLSGSDGRYAFPAWVGPLVLTATKTSTGDQGSGSVLLSDAGERAELDLLLAIVRPSVVATTPVSGATGIPVGIEPVVQFSEPVEHASLDAAMTLRPAGGALLEIVLHIQSAQVTLEPTVSLEPETTYELTIGEGVRDLQGHGLAAPVTVSFTTQSVVLPSTVDLDRVLLYAPGTNGESRIKGLPGAAPAGTLVFVENLTRLAATMSVAAEQDGSFDLSIVAQVTDRLLLHVLIAGANEVVAILGPFRTADGRGAYIGAGGSTFTTIDGWTFSVPADAFEETTVVQVVPRVSGQLPVPLPASFVEGASFKLDFGGAMPDKAIELALPAPAGAPAGRPILVLREVRAAGAHGWMLHELATAQDERLSTLAAGAAPFSGELFASQAGGARAEAGTGPSLAEFAAAAPGAMLPGIAFAGNYTISWTPEPIGFLGFPTNFWNNAYVETGLSGIVTVLNSAIESLLEHDAVLIPTLLGVPVTVTVRDGVSGFVLYQSEPGDFYSPPGDGGIAEIPPEVFGDTTAPHPIAGSSLRLFVLDAAEAAVGEIDRGVSFLFTDDAVEITGAIGSVSGEARVRLLGLDDTRAPFTTAAADGSFQLQASIEASNSYLLALGARIDATEAIEVEWSEALGDVLGALRVLDDAGLVIGVDVDFGADRSVVVVTPRGAWPTDRGLRLELGPAIADGSGNSWNKTLALEFRARASQVVGHYPFQHVYDVARLGNLLFLAAGQQGLAVLDASDPSELANVMPGGLTFPLALSDVVRAVAVDPHGRVLVAGGGVANFGVLRIFDPLVLPEIVDAPDAGAARGLAWRGTTIVSDRLGGAGTQLPAGTPRKVVLYSDDLTSYWRVGEPAPDGLAVTFTPGASGALGTLAVIGNGAASVAPVSLRNLTRGGFRRVDSNAAGGFTIAIAAASGERVELLRNRATVAYLATLGVGVEAVDVNAFYHASNEPSPAASRVVGIYSGAGDPSFELCNELASELASALIGLDLLVEGTASPPIDVAALVGFRGIAEIESPPSAAGNLSFFADACAEVEGSRAVRALAAAVDLPWDANADGRVDDAERERDYAFVTHATGGLLVFDLTQRSDPHLVARIRLPLVALGVAIDRTRMRAYVSGASGGLAIVDLAALATTTLVDADVNGVDDRVLEVVPIPAIQPGSPAVVLPDLGLVFVGGDGGAVGIQVGAPEIVFVRADGSGERLH